MLGDWSGHRLSPTTEHVIYLDQAQRLVDHVSRYLGTRRPRLMLLEDSSTILHAVLKDCFDHSPTIGRRLISSATCEIGLAYS
jgi:hypothetical protein